MDATVDPAHNQEGGMPAISSIFAIEVMDAAIRRGTMAMRDAKPVLDARRREFHDAYEAGVILREAEPGSLDAFLDAGACCAGADE